MKTMRRFFSGLMVLAMCGTSLLANDVKFGIVNFEELVRRSPETKKMMDSLETVSKNYQTQMGSMVQEMQNKIKETSELGEVTNSSTKDFVFAKRRLESDINNLRTRIEELQVTAEQDMQDRQASLVKPIIDKLSGVIRKYGEDNKFTFVFYENATVYHASTVVDLTEVIAKQLNLPKDGYLNPQRTMSAGGNAAVNKPMPAKPAQPKK